MSQIKVLGLALLLSFMCGKVQAQAVDSQGEMPRAAREEVQKVEDSGGFEETYAEQVAREQMEQEQAAQQAEQARQESENSVLATVPQGSSSNVNTPIDYKGIANAYFSGNKEEKAENSADKAEKPQPKTYEDVIFTITEPTSKATLGMGHTIDLKLRTSSNLKWNFDKEFQSLEYLSERTEDGFFHVVFKAKAPGQETVYFDCLDVGNPDNIQVLETKLIVIKVE